MDFMRCPKCGQPITYILTETIEYPMTADGAFMVANARFIWSPRENIDLICEECQEIFAWTTDENGRLHLLN